MSSLRQIEANRRNALKSTGPQTEAGKAAVRANALKSGIFAVAEVIPGEQEEELAALRAEYHEHWNPTTPEARMLVDSLVSDEWQLRRLRTAEARLWSYLALRAASEGEDAQRNWQGCALFHGDKSFDRLQRRVNAIRRNSERALKQLQSLADRESAETEQPPAPPPRRELQEDQSDDDDIGFVSSRDTPIPSGHRMPSGFRPAPEYKHLYEFTDGYWRHI